MSIYTESGVTLFQGGSARSVTFSPTNTYTATTTGNPVYVEVQGEPLTITEKGHAFDITDSKGRTARITIADVLQSNGVIHVINKVLMP